VKYIVDGLPPSIPGITIKYKINSEILKQEINKDVKKDKEKCAHCSKSHVCLKIPADNKLPYVNQRFYDRFFQLIRVDEIIALYSALMSETKRVLVVCEHQYDLLPIFLTLYDLMYPFEWSLNKIPFLVSNPDHPNLKLFEYINTLQHIILGIHHTAFEGVKEKMLNEDPENLKHIIVLDLRYTYKDPTL
jgi:hypothetical protein